ncbi:hypothetical protein V6N11_002233 [Hibiscus sabdariffa]|uniref:Homeobox domain-containing protein n=1 Tax=Hibiscus sabdariffa TaxID=183260 RepID=A0ABR2QV07_9ROSI
MDGFLRSLDSSNLGHGLAEEPANGGGSYRQASPNSVVSSFSSSGIKRERDLSNKEDEDGKEKQALAKQLNLRPRQVEVWFQNIRAMTKLKQTEVDCELLKKCCETLTGENKRLQKELQELKALNLAQPFYTLVLAAILTMCSSCEIVDGVGGGTSDNPFSVLAPNPHFYTPFTNTSEVC